MLEASMTIEGTKRKTADAPTPVGIKLGSARTVAAQPHGDTVQTGTALTCLATYEDVLTGGKQVVYGKEAATKYPERVQFMLRSGLPEDAERATMAKTFFDTFIQANNIPTDSVVVYAIPALDNEKGFATLSTVIEESAVGEQLIRSYPESLCGSIQALGTGLDALDRIFIAINMGSTTLEACVYRRGEQLSRFSTGAVTGSEVDRWIVNYVQEESHRRVSIDRTTAREYKEQHGDFNDFEPFTDIIQQPDGSTPEFTIERSVMDALDRYVDETVDEIVNSFLPQLASDHLNLYKQTLGIPIVLTGGMVCIPGLLETFEERLSEELQHEVEVTAPDEPELAAARGAQRIAEHFVDTAME